MTPLNRYLVPLFLATGALHAQESADIIIYGGTSASIAAAVQAKKMGASVIVVSPDKHLGGLSSGGLGFTDSGRKETIGGVSREFYQKIYAASGGVPAEDGGFGTFINYPDADLADPRWNQSNVPWHTLYYGDGYARLQRVKARWDPRNVFHHALSVRS